MRTTTILILSAILVNNTCGLLDSPSGNNFQPEMIYIDQDLTVTIGPSWDSTVYSIADSLPIVTLTPYYIGKYELTNIQFFQFVNAGGYSQSKYWSDEGWNTRTDSTWGKPKYWGDGGEPWESDPYSSESSTPVHAISYYEAEAYCNWLSQETGSDYHLPQSAQWIRAAKGPDPGTRYPWGNDFIERNAYYPLENNVQLVSVSSYPEGKSAAGCFQMIGNVYELSTRIPDESSDFQRLYSFYDLSCSSPPCMKETMTTTHGWIIDKWERRDFVGMRVCRY